MGWLDSLLSWIRGALVALATALGGAEAPPAYQGYIEAEYVRLAGRGGGTLQTLAVRRGDRVAAGSLMFLLDPERERIARDEAAARLRQAEAVLADLQKGRREPEIRAIEARLRQAEASLALSAVELGRQERLAGSGVVSESRLDEARATHARDRARLAELAAELETARLAARDDALEAAAAAVELARAQLAAAEWALSERAGVAPADALVADIYFREGEEVPDGAAVVSLLPPANVKVRFFLPEPALSAVTIGETVALDCDGCPPDLRAIVSFVSPEAEFTPPVIFSNETRAKLVFRVEARPQGAARRLLPGQPVTVRPLAP